MPRIEHHDGPTVVDHGGPRVDLAPLYTDSDQPVAFVAQGPAWGCDEDLMAWCRAEHRRLYREDHGRG